MNIILATALSGIILMFSSFFTKNNKPLNSLSIFLFMIIILAGFLQLQGFCIFADKFSNMINNNSYGIWFFIILSCISAYYLLINKDLFEKVGQYVSEYYALIFFSFTGIAILSVFDNLVMMFLGIEILSIPMYILAGTDKINIRSTEASIKYFLMGAFSTGIMMMGIAFIYGGTGTFTLSGISTYLPELQNVYFFGWILLIFSLCFKVAVAPFHFWAADVYDGTPTVFTSYMSTIVKGAAFLAFISVLSAFPFDDMISKNYQIMIIFIIILTLLIGNFSAAMQSSVKRMMAFSSIAQAGFMMFIIFQIKDASKAALLYYILGYSIANIIIFYAIAKVKDDDISSFYGLSKKSPVLAFSVAVSLISLAGIPFTSGFMAKLMALSLVPDNENNIYLIVFALIMAVISVYYYFKVIVAMYFKNSKNDDEFIMPYIPFTNQVAVIAGIAIIIILGICPDILFNCINIK